MHRLALVLLVGGCALNPFERPYLPPGPQRSVEGPPVVGVAAATDQRIGDAFRTALAARSLLAEGPPRYMLSVTTLRYASARVPDVRATVKFHLDLSDATGKSIYGDDLAVENVEGTVFALDTDSRRLEQRSLQQAVDDALDKPGFRAQASK